VNVRRYAVDKEINLLMSVGTSNNVPATLLVDRLPCLGTSSQNVCTTGVSTHLESFGYS
jgi:hypothetical protein